MVIDRPVPYPHQLNVFDERGRVALVSLSLHAKIVYN